MVFEVSPNTQPAIGSFLRLGRVVPLKSTWITVTVLGLGIISTSLISRSVLTLEVLRIATLVWLCLLLVGSLALACREGPHSEIGWICIGIFLPILVVSPITMWSAAGFFPQQEFRQSFFWWFRIVAAVAALVAGLTGAMLWAEAARKLPSDDLNLSSTKYQQRVAQLNWKAAVWTAIAVANASFSSVLGLVATSPFKR